MSAAARDVLAAGRRLPRLPVLAVAVLACAVGAACAAEEPPSPWRFEIEPYGWVSGTYGTIDVDQYVARLDVTPGNLLTAVFDGNALAAAGYFAVAYERWSVFADVYGGGAKVNVDEDIPTLYCTLTVDAKDTMRFVLADFAVGYRLGQWSLPERRLPLELGVYAGARYVHFANHLRGGVAVVGGQRYSGDADEANDWADPIIGVRWSVPVLDSVSLTFRGDIGGFGASSDLDWGLVSDVRYWLDVAAVVGAALRGGGVPGGRDRPLAVEWRRGEPAAARAAGRYGIRVLNQLRRTVVSPRSACGDDLASRQGRPISQNSSADGSRTVRSLNG